MYVVGFRVSRFRAQGLGCRVQGLGCRVQGVGCRVQGLGSPLKCGKHLDGATPRVRPPPCSRSKLQCGIVHPEHVSAAL